MEKDFLINNQLILVNKNFNNLPIYWYWVLTS